MVQVVVVAVYMLPSRCQAAPPIQAHSGTTWLAVWLCGCVSVSPYQPHLALLFWYNGTNVIDPLIGSGGTRRREGR